MPKGELRALSSNTVCYYCLFWVGGLQVGSLWVSGWADIFYCCYWFGYVSIMHALSVEGVLNCLYEWVNSVEGIFLRSDLTCCSGDRWWLLFDKPEFLPPRYKCAIFSSLVEAKLVCLYERSLLFFVQDGTWRCQARELFAWPSWYTQRKAALFSGLRVRWVQFLVVLLFKVL